MLKIFNSISQLDFRMLMDVYEETNRLAGKMDYPDEPENLQVLFAEQDFYCFLELFFQDPDSVYAVWLADGQYKAALRLERYRDGKLITALETLPEARRKGYAACLIESLKLHIAEPIYSHVSKNNVPSLEVHKKCGFCITEEEAVFLDGTIHFDHYTLELKNAPAAR